MGVPATTSGLPLQPAAWHELEESLARLGVLARKETSGASFYNALLADCVRTLPARGGVVWMRSASGPLQPIATRDWAGDDAFDSESRRDHEQALLAAARDGQVAITNSRAHKPLLISPVNLEPALDAAPGAPARGLAVAIIVVELAPDLSPGAERGCIEYMDAVREIAAEFQAYEGLRRLIAEQGYRDALARFGRDVHRSLDLAETAFAVANDGPRIVGCDRLSVLVIRGSRARLLAASGVGQAERRSNTARQLEQLAAQVSRTDQPALFVDGQCEALPPVSEILQVHAEESGARRIVALPVGRESPADDAEVAGRAKRHRSAPRFVLIAERFDAHGDAPMQERLAEVAGVSANALYHSEALDRLPFRWGIERAARLQEFIREHVARSSAIAAAAIAAVAILMLWPADFQIEASGRLQPVTKRDIFAPRGGIVDEILVEPGAEVAAGAALLRLRDPELALEIGRVRGEIETAERQREAVRAARTSRAARDASEPETYRLSAEERELDQRLVNLRAELAHYESQREALLVRSPIAGRVLSWELSDRLAARPVQRGEVLLTVADPAGDWQLELDVADDQIGHVLAAREASDTLAVDFRLSSDDRELHTGHVSEIALTADVAANEAGAAPSVLVQVAVPEAAIETMRRDDLRPGVGARARILCGQRSLGYVWFHDLWDAVVGWIRF